jgi:putative salt-induced outer membrane protein
MVKSFHLSVSILALAILSPSLIPFKLLAQESAPAAAVESAPAQKLAVLKNSSELAASISSGNTTSETYLIKQLTSYETGSNKFGISGKMQKAISQDKATKQYVDSADNWEAGARYEYAVTDAFSGFVAHTISHDKFAGLKVRRVWDIGPKYYWFKRDYVDWSTELGFRNGQDESLDGTSTTYNSLRLYNEWNQKWDEKFSSKLWSEVIPNLDDPEGDAMFSEDHDYQINVEASITTTLTSVFSLKMAYLRKYDNQPSVAEAEKFDSLLTTSLIANW